ncbi:4159d68c-3291-4313-9b2a-ad5586edc72e [Sclerotinia trifoliorum]|uniref:4159d68c-3291-4313-9b2a-ad5586edc72e n=1 Tax=Sclerotinia trifoliorum TaxID=28548 RepID=A0A8H2VM10_9HELO|nr:4159d68c-3291-4313-9b2a-ad5586edc72e [Sclerotinia trifoliorum]
MLDPISAFSLAASIIKFVDFTSKITSTAAELHHSSSGALANNLELSMIVLDLSDISNDLKARNPHQEKHGYSKDELALISLASKCEELSGKLLHDLDGLKIKGSHTLWFRSQLLLRLVALLNDRHSAMSAAFIELQRCQGRMETNTEQSGDIYWINGNAGSGKSTLMKYVVGHDDVKNALTDWAGTKPLFTGNYYFWSAGNEMEKSQQGLLRSLLYDILGNCPSVLPKLFPDRWVSPNHAGINIDGSWSQAELLDAFNQLTKNQSEIERFLTPIPGQSLSLQDFTREDIKDYIHDLITEDPGFSNTQIDERYGNLIDEISDKSGGVFLWVALAVREILKD